MPLGVGRQARVVLIVLALLGSVLFAAASCARQKVVIGDAHRFPEPASIVLPVPNDVATASGPTEALMRNVLLHVDDNLRLNIRYLRGRMSDTDQRSVAVLDDKNHLQIDIAHAEIALTPEALTILLNRYVFGYRGSPLKDLVVRTAGDHIVQTGTMHKLIDIPFEMTAQLSVTPDHRIRIHTTRMKICSLDGEKLLKAFGMKLENVLNLKGAKGVKVQGNDLYLEPLASLPPPRINGTLTAIRVADNEVVQTFGSAADAGAVLTPPIASRNFVYFRAGSIRFGKLFMVQTDLLAIDADESDPFDFYLDYYHSQLVAGYHTTLANYALVAWMPDFDDLGTVKGRPKPPPISAK